MASLLSKFRIDYSALKVIADVSKPAQPRTKDFFDSLIADFQGSSQPSGSVEDGTITVAYLFILSYLHFHVVVINC